MNSKTLLLLPICFMGLTSCAHDTFPKVMTFNDALTYIKTNAKEVVAPKEGYVEYTCTDTSVIQPGEAKYYGITGEIKTSGKNGLDPTKIEKYMEETANPKSSEQQGLPLMYLIESNFKSFIGEDSSLYTFTLTNVKEFIMSATYANTNCVRYYNKDLRLTRIEVNDLNKGKEYTITQSYIY